MLIKGAAWNLKEEQEEREAHDRARNTRGMGHMVVVRLDYPPAPVPLLAAPGRLT